MSLTADQKKEFAGLITAAFLQAGMGSNKSADITKLCEYTGGPNYQDFKREVIVYVIVNEKKFSDGQAKILFVLLYLKSSHAGMWSQNYLDSKTDAVMKALSISDNFDAFIDELDAAFNDPNRKDKAIAELYRITQGQETANKFFVKFEIIRIKAGLNKMEYDNVLITQLRKALDLEVVQGIMRAATIPTTYKGWKETAINVDRVEQQVRHIKNTFNHLLLQPGRCPMSINSHHQCNISQLSQLKNVMQWELPLAVWDNQWTSPSTIYAETEPATSVARLATLLANAHKEGL